MSTPARFGMGELYRMQGNAGKRLLWFSRFILAVSIEGELEKPGWYGTLCISSSSIVCRMQSEAVRLLPGNLAKQ